MLKEYINLKFNSVVVPSSLLEKDFGGTVLLAGVPLPALYLEFEALKLAKTIEGFTIGGALNKNGKPIQGVYQITWWNNHQNSNNKNSNKTKRTKHP